MKRRNYPKQYWPWNEKGNVIPLYQCWKHMKERCNLPSDKGYHRYGGRGITVCEEWNYWPNFAKWALGNGYDTKLEIDRIDNDGNYEPSNCRFVTHKENCNNRDPINFSKSLRKKFEHPFIHLKTKNIYRNNQEAIEKFKVGHMSLWKSLKGRFKKKSPQFMYLEKFLGSLTLESQGVSY